MQLQKDLSQFVSLIKKWHNDPISFCSEILNIELVSWQKQAFTNSLEFKKLSVRSGHGVGKTTFLACFILWFITTKYPATVVVTAPTFRQLYDVLWTEISRIAARTDPWFSAQWLILKDRIELIGANRESFATARTARHDVPEALQGVHGKNVAILVDEASGVPDAVFEVGEGSLSDMNTIVILCGNPLRPKGYFFDSFRGKQKFWKNMHVSCLDSELVSKEYVAYMKNKYGENSNQFKIRVLGDFPSSDDESVISLELVESAIGRDIVIPPVYSVWGLDVARSGKNKSALAKRIGPVLLEPIKWWAGIDTMQLADFIVEEYESTPPDERPIEIDVDVIGVGAGVVDRLHQLGLPVNGINVAERPGNTERYLNLKAELWFKCREWFEKRSCSIVDDPELIYQLTDVSYKYTRNGKIQIESKEDMIKRGSESPDLADSLVLTFVPWRDVPLKKNDIYNVKSVKKGSWLSI